MKFSSGGGESANTKILVLENFQIFNVFSLHVCIQFNFRKKAIRIFEIGFDRLNFFKYFIFCRPLF